MPSYMLDTNVLIHMRRHRPTHVAQRMAELRPGDAIMSVITYGELRHGAEKSQRRQTMIATLEAMAAIVPVEQLPIGAGEDYGRIRAHLERGGEIIGSNDLWIAAHAVSAKLTLVTANESEFRRVPGLSVENWAIA